MFEMKLPRLHSVCASSVQRASWCLRTFWEQNTVKRTFFFGWHVKNTRKLPVRKKWWLQPKGSTQSLSKLMRPDRYGFYKMRREWSENCCNFKSTSIVGLLVSTVTLRKLQLLLQWNSMCLGYFTFLCCSALQYFFVYYLNTWLTFWKGMVM